MAIAAYARKSIEKENSISIDTQLEYCRAMLKPDERNEKIIEFIDNGYSGGNINRDGFQKMMKLIKQGKITKVIVYKLDRISRSLNDFVNILQVFKDYNVEFVSSQEAFDTSSPYGELIVKILMVFAEFERTSIINRITQAYSHRSEMGFYMGGRRPYGFELLPTIINGIKTKKLSPLQDEIEHIKYIFEAYSVDGVSLRRLQDNLLSKGIKPISGVDWTTAKLSTLLKNPIYVKADADIYDYFDKISTKIINDVNDFTGQYGLQLYNKTKHNEEPRLVMLTHEGVIASDIWLKCQKKLESNIQIGNSLSNKTSWLAGLIICDKCKHTMTTIKGKPDTDGNFRRYFNCTGKSHKKKCSGTNITIYAENLENMVYSCISEKLSSLNSKRKTIAKNSGTETNLLKIKLKEVEISEKQLMETTLSGGFNDALLRLANEKAEQLQREKTELYERIESLKTQTNEVVSALNLSRKWDKASYNEKKSVAGLLINKIIMFENGEAQIIWNI